VAPVALLVSLLFVALPFRDFLMRSPRYIMDAFTNKQEVVRTT